jgi:hypothetical protein
MDTAITDLLVNHKSLQPLFHRHYTSKLLKKNLIDWLIIYCFTSCSRIFHLYGYVTNTGEGLQNLGLCLAVRAFEQGGNFLVPHQCCDICIFGFSGLIRRTTPFSRLVWHTRCFGESIITRPDPHKSPFSHLLQYARGCQGPILTRILTGKFWKLGPYYRYHRHNTAFSAMQLIRSKWYLDS